MIPHGNSKNNLIWVCIMEGKCWFADHVIMELEGLALFIALWSWEELGFCPFGYIWDHSLSLNSKLGAGFDLCKAKKCFSIYFYI